MSSIWKLNVATVEMSWSEELLFVADNDLADSSLLGFIESATSRRVALHLVKILKQMNSNYCLLKLSKALCIHLYNFTFVILFIYLILKKTKVTI